MSNENTSPAAKTSSVVTVRDVQTESFEAPAPSSVERSVGVMNTAKASHGGTLSGEPGDGDVVTVNGMSMTLSTALKHGFVAQDAQGRYVDLPADSEQAKEFEKEQRAEEARQQEEDETHMLAFDTKVAEELVGVSNLLEESGANPTAVIGQFMKSPETLPDSLKTIVRDRGMDEAETLKTVRKLAGAVEESIEDYVISVAGISAEQLPKFWGYVRNTVGDTKLAGATINALFMGDTRPFFQFARNFITAHGSGRGSAENVENRKVGTGVVKTVSVPGSNMRTSVEVARRLKLA